MNRGAQRIDGNVIDASDFPNIGHTWLLLDGLYYDPTFDDSSGNISGKTYFALPYNIFYVNRFNFGTLPSHIKTLSMSERKNIIRSKLSELSSQYDINKYPIFSYYNVDNNFLQKTNDTIAPVSEEEMEFNAAPEEKIISPREKNPETNSLTPDIQQKKFISEKPQNIQDLQLRIPYYEVKKFMYKKQGIEYIITKMDYYTISPDNFSDLMNQIEYKLDGMILYKWDNGTYRLAYRVEEQ